MKQAELGVDVEIPDLRSAPKHFIKKPRVIQKPVIASKSEFGDPGLDLEEFKIRKCEQALINTLGLFHPDATSKKKLAITSGYSSKSGGFNNALSRLNTLELIERDGDIMASKELCE